jgi:hypothetical protein
LADRKAPEEEFVTTIERGTVNNGTSPSAVADATQIPFTAVAL